MGFLEVFFALAIKKFEERRPKLISWEIRKINSRTHYSWKRHALCYAVFGFARNRWLNTSYWIVGETKYARFTMLNIPKCENFTLLVCPLRFLVISAVRQLGNVQSFKTYMFRFWAFCHERDPGWAGYPILTHLHGKLSPGLAGLPYLADRATRLGGSLHLSWKRDRWGLDHGSKKKSFEKLKKKSFIK